MRMAFSRLGNALQGGYSNFRRGEHPVSRAGVQAQDGSQFPLLAAASYVDCRNARSAASGSEALLTASYGNKNSRSSHKLKNTDRFDRDILNPSGSGLYL